MAPSRTPESVLNSLSALNTDREITILKLSEPIASHDGQTRQRASDVSNASLDAPTPTSLEADLAHYRELFAKLRFSYVEQVTKEKFIRAIVGDPPLIVSSQENVNLEKLNLEAKATLKQLKIDVADMVAALGARGRELSQKYNRIKLETVKLQDLPSKVANLEESIAALREAQADNLHPNPDMNLPLSRTMDLVDAHKRQRDDLDRQLEQLQSLVPRKKKELDRLQAELQTLEARRQTSTTAAREARRRKEAALGGVEDDLEERGRWFRAAEASLRQMLELENQT